MGRACGLCVSFYQRLTAIDLKHILRFGAIGATDLPILEQRNTWARRAANTGGSHHGRLHHASAHLCAYSESSEGMDEPNKRIATLHKRGSHGHPPTFRGPPAHLSLIERRREGFAPTQRRPPSQYSTKVRPAAARILALSCMCRPHRDGTMRDKALRLEHIASMCVDQSANGAADGGDCSLARSVTSSERNEANCCMRMRALHHSKSLTLRAR